MITFCLAIVRLYCWLMLADVAVTYVRYVRPDRVRSATGSCIRISCNREYSTVGSVTEGAVLSNAHQSLSTLADRAVTEPRLGLRLAEVQGGPRVTLPRAPSSSCGPRPVWGVHVPRRHVTERLDKHLG